ncbi:MAG: type II secretion system F family protein [Betaproteobacteria bacterium]|nr:type II secretion system F family protein [Betaproteobacteria bacterium]
MIWYIVIGIAVAAAIVLVVLGLAEMQWQIPEEEREYLDPLPFILRLFWPLIRFVAHYAGARMPASWLEAVHRRLARSGANYMMNAEEFFAVMFIGAGAGYAFAFLAVHSLGGVVAAVVPLLLAVIGAWYPFLWLGNRYATREKDILKALPMFLDYLTLAMEAGLNLAGALAQTVEKGPAGAMRQELFLVLRDLRAGLGRADALRRMDNRLKIPEVSSVVSSVIQAEQVGASVGKVLRTQAERRRTERFQRAEKLAMEAPVKLILPLVLFIFPTTFIILAFPIVMMIKQQGVL